MISHARVAYDDADTIDTIAAMISVRRRGGAAPREKGTADEY